MTALNMTARYAGVREIAWESALSDTFFVSGGYQLVAFASHLIFRSDLRDFIAATRYLREPSPLLAQNGH
jgi:hypothetical protein